MNFICLRLYSPMCTRFYVCKLLLQNVGILPIAETQTTWNHNGAILISECTVRGGVVFLKLTEKSLKNMRHMGKWIMRSYVRWASLMLATNNVTSCNHE